MNNRKLFNIHVYLSGFIQEGLFIHFTELKLYNRK